MSDEEVTLKICRTNILEDTLLSVRRTFSPCKKNCEHCFHFCCYSALWACLIDCISRTMKVCTTKNFSRSTPLNMSSNWSNRAVWFSLLYVNGELNRALIVKHLCTWFCLSSAHFAYAVNCYRQLQNISMEYGLSNMSFTHLFLCLIHC